MKNTKIGPEVDVTVSCLAAVKLVQAGGMDRLGALVLLLADLLLQQAGLVGDVEAGVEPQRGAQPLLVM